MREAFIIKTSIPACINGIFISFTMFVKFILELYYSVCFVFLRLPILLHRLLRFLCHLDQVEGVDAG